MKKDRRFEKSVRFLAAAALSAALLGSQLPVVLAAENSVESASGIKMEDLFPDNITVTDPVSLAEVGFPDNKYGKLKWVDDSIELTEHVQSCEAVFVPEEGIDLTDMEGWDKELGGVVSHIHVIVSSIAGDDMDEETGELEETEESQETESEDMDAVEEETSGEWEDEQEDTGVSDENEADTEEPSEESDDEDADAEILPEDGGSEEEDSEDSAESGGTDAEENNGEASEEENSQDDSSDKDDNGAEEEQPDKEDSDIEENENSDSDSENSEEPEVPQDSENSGEENDSNIFDDPEDFDEEDERPTELPESLTEEEKLQHAIMNHSCEGISVSGINLPWYVQFRVTSGESYEFANESEAEIFKSYEFELWDLQNNTEYEIPDGEYISVTVPVKEGYDYTVEHLLDNGATETIVPSVEGGIMVFSTHSFSPFGIAGSMQMVGPDFPIEDEVKPTVTPTPSVTGKPGENGTSGNNGATGNNGGTNAGAGTNNGGSNGTGGAGNSTGISGNGSNSGQNGTSGNSGAGSSTGISGNSSNSGQNGTSGNSSTGNGAVNNTGNSTGSQSSGSHAVETGDTTAILPFVALILAAVILIGAVVYLKTKKK